MGLGEIAHAVVVVSAVVLAILTATVTVAGVVVVRRLRRRYRALVIHLRPEALAATVGSATWWAGRRDRHRMWRAVAAAERAVGVAERAGAPVGDLPSLSRRLRVAATSVDAALQAGAGGRPADRGLVAERVRIEAAAADVQRAAVTALSAIAGADTAPVVDAVRVEVAALAAGIRAARPAPR